MSNSLTHHKKKTFSRLLYVQART